MVLNYGSSFPENVWNRLIKREWLLKNKLFFKKGVLHDDLLWTFHAAKYVKSMAVNKTTTHHYRYNPNGCMSTIQRGKCIEDYNIIIKDWLAHLDCHCLSSQLYAVIHVAHTSYIWRFGGAERLAYIRMFYPFIYLLWLFFIKREKIRIRIKKS